MSNTYDLWAKTGVMKHINDELARRARIREGRGAEPTAAILDSQSVKGSVQSRDCGYDAAKKVKGRKRHVLMDTLGSSWLLRLRQPVFRTGTWRDPLRAKPSWSTRTSTPGEKIEYAGDLTPDLFIERPSEDDGIIVYRSDKNVEWPRYGEFVRGRPCGYFDGERTCNETFYVRLCPE